MGLSDLLLESSTRNSDTISMYDQQAIDFLKHSGTEMKIKFLDVVQGFPFDNKDNNPHRHYEVTLKRHGRSMKFPFYGSAADYRSGKDPSAYDVLACLQKYEVESSPEEFAKEFGYELNTDSDLKRVRKIWYGCREEYRKLFELFDRSEYWMSELAEIS